MSRIVIELFSLWVSFAWLVASQNERYKVNNMLLDGPDVTIEKLWTPKYLIISSKTLRPGKVYRVAVSILTPGMVANVRASIQKDGVELSQGQELISYGASKTILVPIPLSSVGGNYLLHIEGNIPGSFGGTLFSNSTELQFSPQFLAILIQLNKPLYVGPNAVKFRVILLTTSLKPFDDPVDIYILDPRGYIMRRWPSHQTNQGVLSLVYQLPDRPTEGFWNIKVQSLGQVEQKKFLVETHFPLKFEVIVNMPTYYLDTEPAITGSVACAFSNEQPIRGNATIKLLARPDPNTYPDLSFAFISQEVVIPYELGYEFSFDMRLVKSAVPNLNNAEVKVEVTIREIYMGIEDVGFTISKIINGSLSLKFLSNSPFVFKPGMPYEDHIAVTYHDETSLEKERLDTGQIRITGTASQDSGGRVPIQEINIYHPQDGIAHFKFTVPPKASKIVLTATYTDYVSSSPTTELIGYSVYSPQDQYLKVECSTQLAKIGEFAIFHVRSNFIFSDFSYLVIAKDIVLFTGQETIDDTHPTIRTLALPVSSDMAPTFRLIVYHVTLYNEVISDALVVPVDAITKHEVELFMNDKKDHNMNTVEMKSSGDPGAYFATSGTRFITYAVQGRNEIDEAIVQDSLHSFETQRRSIHHVLHRSRTGEPYRKQYFQANNYGMDTLRTFDFAGLVALTDANIPIIPSYTSSCNESAGYRSCYFKGCYKIADECNGVNDCMDGSDESNCFHLKTGEDRDLDFRLKRFARFADFLDTGDDWLWNHFNLDAEGEDIRKIEIAGIQDTWVINGFGVSNKHGFGFLSGLIKYSSVRPFVMAVEAPGLIRAHEQVGIRVILFNNLEIEVIIMVVLPDSDDYRFIHVEPDGIVNHYNPRTSRGEHQHIVYMLPGQSMDVYYPIVPTIERGEFDVTIKGISQARREEQTVTISVVAQGVVSTSHTSVILDLKNRANVLKFLDIPIDESPIILYKNWRRYVFGSPEGSVTLSGDIVGAAFPSSPMNKEISIGYGSQTTEDFIFDFAINFWWLQYMRQTNQWDWGIARDAFDGMNVYYGQVMLCFTDYGGFKMYESANASSVWLTAWVLRQFSHAYFTDWENYIYIDPKVLEVGISWLCQHQTPEGSFTEVPEYLSPLILKMDPRSKIPGDRLKYRNVTLTAHMLITLQTVVDKVQGKTRINVNNAKNLATKYLEKVLQSLEDGYEICLVTYALHMVNSYESELAFVMMERKKLQLDGMTYWSRDPIEGLPIHYENSKPFLGTKSEQEWDGLAVEATAYALMVYVMREGIQVDQEKIVNWLNSNRMHANGFIATIDTAVALQALTEYSFRARLRDITDMRVTIEPTAQPERQETIFIGNQSIAQVHTVTLENVWGHINIIAKGSGQALLQLDLSKGYDYEAIKDTPPKDAFELTVEEHYHRWRNNSRITIRSCTRWINQEENYYSGAAILDIEIPSGFKYLDFEAGEVVAKGDHPHLRDCLVTTRSILWYFDKLGPDQNCFNFTITRWYPVANNTFHRKAILFEAFQPERFVVSIIRALPLYVLNVCEVCGSYQCPYCLFYSKQCSVRGDLVTIVLISSLTIIISELFRRFP